MSPPRRFEGATRPSLHVARGVQATMGLVLVALLPGMATMVLLFGPGVLVQVGWALLFAMLVEASMLALRGVPLRPALTDLSAVLTAVLFALAMPPGAPWWVAAVGMVAAIGVAKQLFGGLGHNPFNPAMVGVAVVILAFPYEYTRWLAPQGWDSLAQATPLDVLRQGAQAGATLGEIGADPRYAAGGWGALALAWLAGGVLLLWTRVIPWQTPVAVLGGTLLLTLPFWLADGDHHPSPLAHLAMGSLVFAAVFIVTDPVSGCATPRGRLLFGFGVAAITLAIRRWGALPDGVAFAVLLMNAAAPLIDRWAQARPAARRARDG